MNAPTSTPIAVSTNIIMTIRSFGLMSRDFTFTPKVQDKPKLILIGGCTGTGKSTFGMSVALDQDILKCISTDTVRAVMRSFIGTDISPALHRSSYTPAIVRDDGGKSDDDPVRSWRETCTVLQASIEGLVDDAIHRGMSLVVEGVHVVPSKDLIQKWEGMGGVATGCLLTIPDEQAHKQLLQRRAT
jgi:2-phosphoglycerate kinase